MTMDIKLTKPIIPEKEKKPVNFKRRGVGIFAKNAKNIIINDKNVITQVRNSGHKHNL